MPVDMHTNSFRSGLRSVWVQVSCTGRKNKQRWVMESQDARCREAVQLCNWRLVGLILLENVNIPCPTSSFVAWGTELGLGAAVEGPLSTCPSAGCKGCFGKLHPRTGSSSVLCMGCMTRNTVCLCGKVAGSRCASFLV